jgi:peptide/nickel transport system permease protein
LPIGFFTTYVPMIYGVVLGAYRLFRWHHRRPAMRILDITVAFPFLVLIIVIVAVLGPGVQNIYIAVFLTAWRMRGWPAPRCCRARQGLRAGSARLGYGS